MKSRVCQRNEQKAIVRFLEKAAKRSGLKVQVIRGQSVLIKCCTKGCDGKVNLLNGFGFAAATFGPLQCGIDALRGVAYPCNKCKRLHENDGSPLQYKTYKRIFLDNNFVAVVKNSRGKVVHQFATSRTKPPRAKSTLIKPARRK